MSLKSKAVVLVIALGAQPALAQQSQPNAMLIAQALDRCMATYAVRLTKTAASDEEIYAEATKGCGPLNARFVDSVKASVPPEQAAELLKEADKSQKPNFLSMLTKIRSDRAKRERPDSAASKF
jgi:hypothetical protein